jgi:membrane protease YdiL (CAAX protease family)
MSQALYTPWPATARRTWGWGALGVVLLTYILSIIPVMVLGAIYGFVQVVGGADPEGVQAALMADTLGFLLPSILIQFFFWGLFIWLWARLFERRRGPSFGLRLSGWAVLRYGVGLVLGVALLAAIGAMALVLGASGEGPDPFTGEAVVRLSDATLLASFAFVIVVFLVQGGSEEVIFRGWLMSTLAARWGVHVAVIVSSLFFMVFHAHVFISGLVFGIIALTGLGLVGLVFALLSLFTRSIVEAIAAHGAFNAAAITLPTLVMLLDNPDLDMSAALAQVFATATGTAGPAATTVGPEMLAQGLTAGIISAALALLLVRRRTSPPHKEQAA